MRLQTMCVYVCKYNTLVLLFAFWFAKYPVLFG